MRIDSMLYATGDAAALSGLSLRFRGHLSHECEKKGEREKKSSLRSDVGGREGEGSPSADRSVLAADRINRFLCPLYRLRTFFSYVPASILSVCLSDCLSLYVSLCVSFCVSLCVSLCVCLSLCLSISLSAYLSTYLYLHMYVCIYP
jgi:hypothetical protein